MAATADLCGFLLARGNSKVGKDIFTFSLPAVATCPGRSRLCAKACYARKGYYRFHSTIRAFERHLKAARRPDFCKRMIWEITARKAKVVRIHAAGDFFSAKYVAAWVKICRATPQVRYFAYTRSHSIPSILEQIEVLATLPNVRMFYSFDRETSLPIHIPDMVRTAYMMVDEHDVPTPWTDLVFHDYPLRKEARKYESGVLVCPAENGITHVQCDKCKLCWNDLTVSDPRRLIRPATRSTRRIALELVS